MAASDVAANDVARLFAAGVIGREVFLRGALVCAT
jgi:hypothetical protein